MALDRVFRVGDPVAMIAQPYRCYIERVDPTQNMARYYAMAIEATLLGQICLTRRWGRIGARGRSMQHSFDREDDAVRLFLHLLRQKRKRGYGPRADARIGFLSASKTPPIAPVKDPSERI